MSWSSICLSDLVVGDAIRRLRSRQPLLSRAHIIPITTIDIDINLVGNSLLVVDPTRSNRKLIQRAVRKRVNAPRSDRRVGVQTISRATCFGSAIRRRSWRIVPNRPSQTVLASAQPDSARADVPVNRYQKLKVRRNRLDQRGTHMLGCRRFTLPRHRRVARL